MGYDFENSTLTSMIGFPCRTFVASQVSLRIELLHYSLVAFLEVLTLLSLNPRFCQKSAPLFSCLGLYLCYLCMLVNSGG